jgi:alpha-glucosidase
VTTTLGSDATPEQSDHPVDHDWWRGAVTYQIYIRSFADSDGDGMGDIGGIASRLGYLTELGVDAIWINPWYPSPQADAGYDVADYRDIDPTFGTLQQARDLILAAHRAGLKVLLDIVPNHTSDEHAWFAAALAAGPGSPERARYLFRAGRGEDGALPPNDWRSVFGGPGWERVAESDGTPGEWYLHLFDVKQPDLDWSNREVRDEFLEVLRFWFDAGADGFRIDVAHGLVKQAGLPDVGLDREAVLGPPDREDHPHWDRPEVLDVYAEWRALAQTYDPPKVFVAEAWVASADRLAEYLAPGLLNTAFDFDAVRAPWQADELRRTISSSLAAHERVGAPVTWVLSNHDLTRHVSRYGRKQERLPTHPVHGAPHSPTDVALGTRRARAALLLELALPGGVYLYQGEELGLPEVEDLPEELLADPVWRQSGFTDRGRDGCRVPIPWQPDGPSLGFGSGPGWLPQPADWSELSAASQAGRPDSMLSLYRQALALRRELPALGAGHSSGVAGLEWLELGADVVAFSRPGGFSCVVNTGSAAVPLPAGPVLLSSVPLESDTLPGDAAVWLQR